jgi:RNA polymerase sigma-70 factor (ECF subfamily)
LPDIGTATIVDAGGGSRHADAALAARLAAGDEAALLAVYDAWGRIALGLALAIAGDRRRAEAAVAEAFRRIWREACSFDATRGSLRAWLMSLVRRAAISARGRDGVRPTAHPRTAPGEPGAAPPDPQAARVAAALAALPEPERRALELAYFGGLSTREIARATAVTEPLARQRLGAAMHRLRLALAPAGVPSDEHVANGS